MIHLRFVVAAAGFAKRKNIEIKIGFSGKV